MHTGYSEGFAHEYVVNGGGGFTPALYGNPNFGRPLGAMASFPTVSQLRSMMPSLTIGTIGGLLLGLLLGGGKGSKKAKMKRLYGQAIGGGLIGYFVALRLGMKSRAYEASSTAMDEAAAAIAASSAKAKAKAGWGRWA